MKTIDEFLENSESVIEKLNVERVQHAEGLIDADKDWVAEKLNELCGIESSLITGYSVGIGMSDLDRFQDFSLYKKPTLTFAVLEDSLALSVGTTSVGGSFLIAVQEYVPTSIAGRQHKFPTVATLNFKELPRQKVLAKTSKQEENIEALAKAIKKVLSEIEANQERKNQGRY